MNIPLLGRIIWIIVVTIVCVILAPLAHSNSIVGMIVALLMISVCWVLAGMIEVGGWISSNNLTLYIFSWFFQAVIMLICGRLKLNWIVTFFAMFGAGIIGPVIVILLYEKLPVLRKRSIKLVLGMRE